MKIFFWGLSLSLLSACQSSFTITSPGLFPEGFAIHKNTLYLSSAHKGVVSKMKKTGKVSQLQTFIDDPELISSLGVKVDKKRNRLLVANADPGFGVRSSPQTRNKLAQVRSYDLKSGQLLEVFHLDNIGSAENYLANDIAIGPKGELYVTDSFAPYIYKISQDAHISIFTQSSLFIPAPNSFGLNGIVSHPDGYLLVAKYDDGHLFKISLNDPNDIHLVEFDQKLNSIDGIVLQGRNELVIASNTLPGNSQVESIVRLKTSDAWKSAKVIKTHKTDRSFPTSLVDFEGDIYYLESFLHELMTGSNQREEFFLKKAF